MATKIFDLSIDFIIIHFLMNIFKGGIFIRFIIVTIKKSLIFLFIEFNWFKKFVLFHSIVLYTKRFVDMYIIIAITINI